MEEIKSRRRRQNLLPVPEGDYLIATLVITRAGDLSIGFDSQFVHTATEQIINDVVASVRDYLLREKGILQ